MQLNSRASLAVALLAVLPSNVAADNGPSFEYSSFSGAGCSGNIGPTVLVGQQTGSCGYVPPPRARRQTSEVTCVNLNGIQSWFANPLSGDEDRNGDKVDYTLFVDGYTSSDCSGEVAKSFSTPSSGCTDFNDNGLMSAKVFVSVCGSPFR